jgi:hypothetical protein
MNSTLDKQQLTHKLVCSQVGLLQNSHQKCHAHMQPSASGVDSPSTVTVALDSAKALAVAVPTAWAAALAAALTLPLPHADATASDTALAVADLASLKVWVLEVATAVTEPAGQQNTQNMVLFQVAGTIHQLAIYNSSLHRACTTGGHKRCLQECLCSYLQEACKACMQIAPSTDTAVQTCKNIHTDRAGTAAVLSLTLVVVAQRVGK